ncbi:MAG TPA: hypothetical protein VFK94_02095, partial [Patescibacteria group bacterium]|nr:hypothetical protein [Patescibacteria group bacterium]
MTTSVNEAAHGLGRFQKIPSLPLMPGECATCSSAISEDGFVDTGLFLEWFGEFYLCKNCLTEMGRLFGLIEPKQYEQHVKLVAKQAEEIESLRASVTSLESQVDALSYERLRSRGMLDLPGIANDDSSDNEVTDEPVSEKPSEPDSLADETDKLLAAISGAE